MKKHRLGATGLAVVVVLAALAIGYYGLFSNGRDAQVSDGGMPVQDFSSPHDLVGFLDSNGPRLSKAEMDAAILHLLALQKTSLKAYETQLFSVELNPIINRYSADDLMNPKNVKEDAIRELIRSILADGFRLSSAEGMVYPEIDFPGIMDRFAPQATESVAAYLAIMARETERHFAADAALMVSPDELGERLAAIEKFMDSNPGFTRLDDVSRLEGYYRSAFLLGLNNTPAFSYKTGHLSETFLNAYRSVTQKHPGTSLASMVSDYLGLLDRNGFRKTQEVLDFVKSAAPRP